MNSTLLLVAVLSAASTPAAPADDFLIFINYELGMHCTGFDILRSSTERGTIVFTKSPVLDNVPTCSLTRASSKR